MAFPPPKKKGAAPPAPKKKGPPAPPSKAGPPSAPAAQSPPPQSQGQGWQRAWKWSDNGTSPNGQPRLGLARLM